MSRISRGRHMLFDRLESPAARQCLTVSHHRSARHAVRRRRAARRRSPRWSTTICACARRATRASPPNRRCATLIRARRPALTPPCAPRRCARAARGARARAGRRAARRGGRVAPRVAAPPRDRASAARSLAQRASRRSRSRRRSCSSSAARSSIRPTDKSARVLAAELTADHVKCFAMNSVLGTHQDAAGGRELDGRRASAGTMHLPGRSGAAPDSSWSARARVSTAKARSRTSCTGTTGGRCRCSCCRRRARAAELVEVLGHEAAIWCVGNRTFVLVAREPRTDVERMASFVQASLR